LFSDDQAVIAKLENGLQLALHVLITVCMAYNFNISTAEIKVMAFEGN
jgi:hypothetical protein